MEEQCEGRPFSKHTHSRRQGGKPTLLRIFRFTAPWWILLKRIHKKIHRTLPRTSECGLLFTRISASSGVNFRWTKSSVAQWTNHHASSANSSGSPNIVTSAVDTCFGSFAFSLAEKAKMVTLAAMKADEVIHLPENSRFEIRVGAHVALLEYQIMGDSITMHHTFVPVELRGKNLASLLADAALEFAKASKLKVIPQCSYIEAYMKRTHFKHL
jgi:predicted GNAT family acetyltransferase